MCRDVMCLTAGAPRRELASSNVEKCRERWSPRPSRAAIGEVHPPPLQHRSEAWPGTDRDRAAREGRRRGARSRQGVGVARGAPDRATHRGRRGSAGLTSRPPARTGTSSVSTTSARTPGGVRGTPRFSATPATAVARRRCAPPKPSRARRAAAAAAGEGEGVRRASRAARLAVLLERLDEVVRDLLGAPPLDLVALEHEHEAPVLEERDLR